jgi:hypothetical protein
MLVDKILSLQVSDLPESDQIILNQISGLTKALNIKVDKLNESLDTLEKSNQEPKEKDEKENKK